MSVYKIDNSNDSQVESLLKDNGIEFRQFESTQHAFIQEQMEQAVIINPFFHTMTPGQIECMTQELIDKDWSESLSSYARRYVEQGQEKELEQMELDNE